MNITAIVQARMSSERLPGKVLLPLGSKPVLSHVIGRLRRATRLSDIVIATSDRPEDDRIERLAQAETCLVYRGDLTDVLSRFCGATQLTAADAVVRITADCPLVAPELVDAMIDRYVETTATVGRPCVVTNARVRTFPRGLDVEIFPRAALMIAGENATEPYQREHVTPYLYEHPELFEIVDYTQPDNMADARWTLDTAEDYELLSKFVSLAGDAEGDASLAELVRVWRENPALHGINAEVVQKSYSRTH